MKESRPSFLSLRILLYKSASQTKRFVAKVLRAMPGVRGLLRLPSGKIRNIKDSAQADYKVIYPPMVIDQLFPKCPTCDNVPPAKPEKIPQKHYNYWDIRSGFDSRNGFYYHPTREIGEVWLASIPNGLLLGPSGAVLTPDHKLLEESIWTWDGWLKNDRSQKSWHLPAPLKLDFPCYTVASNYSEGYPHWLMEVLPRLFALNSLPDSSKPTIIFNSELNSWQSESLNMLGLEAYPKYFLNKQYIQAKQLFFPSYVGIPGSPHPLGCSWVRETILKNTQTQSGSVRIYITRKHAQKRQLLNEDQILPILEKFHFEVVAAEKLSFTEQVQLFARAEAVVTAHGAGLGNLMFAPKGCKVLEILDRDYVNDHYYNLSSILGLDYYYQLCTSLNADQGRKLSPGHDHISIDPLRLEKSLEAMFPR